MSLRSLAAAAVAALLIVLAILWQGALRGRDRAREDLAKAEAALAARTAEAALNHTVAEAVERSLTREAAITHDAKEVADEIGQADGANAQIAADVRDRWGRSVDRLRGEGAGGP